MIDSIVLKIRNEETVTGLNLIKQEVINLFNISNISSFEKLDCLTRISSKIELIQTFESDSKNPHFASIERKLWSNYIDDLEDIESIITKAYIQNKIDENEKRFMTKALKKRIEFLN